MFGKTFQEYARFVRWIIIAIVAVFLVRLGLSLAGVPHEHTRWVSLNLVLLAGLVYCAIAVHTTGFGGYAHLYVLLLLQIGVAHTLIALAIVLGIVTGTNNIFTVPDYSGGVDGKTTVHALLHLIAPPVAAAIVWPAAALILLATRAVRHIARLDGSSWWS